MVYQAFYFHFYHVHKSNFILLKIFLCDHSTFLDQEIRKKYMSVTITIPVEHYTLILGRLETKSKTNGGIKSDSLQTVPKTAVLEKIRLSCFYICLIVATCATNLYNCTPPIKTCWCLLSPIPES